MLHDNVQVAETNTGFGLVALSEIQEGEKIWWEGGFEVQSYTRAQVAELEPAVAMLLYWNGTHYIFTPKESSNHWNHNCNPNTWWEGETIVARRRIRAGEEITMEYALEETTDMPANRFEVCRCGTSKCRGTILPDDLVRYPYLREEYAGHMPPWTEAWLAEQLSLKQK